jgi:hypothetical protein
MMLAMTKTFKLKRNARRKVQDGKCKTGSSTAESARRGVARRGVARRGVQGVVCKAGNGKKL